MLETAEELTAEEQEEFQALKAKLAQTRQNLREAKQLLFDIYKYQADELADLHVEMARNFVELGIEYNESLREQITTNLKRVQTQLRLLFNWLEFHGNE